MWNECLKRKTSGEGVDIANLIIGFLYGTSFGIFLSIFIDRSYDKRFENEWNRKDFKIEKITWLSENDKE